MTDSINYATLMYYQSVINLENRLVKEILIQQEQKQLPNTVYDRVSQLGLATTSIKRIKKSEWKKVCKEKIQKEINSKLQRKCNITKMRIVGKGNGVLIQKIIRIRLFHEQPKKELHKQICR